MIESEKLARKKWSNRHTADSARLQQASKSFWQENSRVPSAGQYNLTICDAPKFIWFRNAKVGTRSTFTAFDKAEIKLTAESLYSCFYFPKEYENYFKFAFVRNPWDRFVSGWLNKVVRNNAFELDPKTLAHLNIFDNFVSHCSTLDLSSWNVHFRHQQKLIDLNELDFIGRHESFDEDLRKIFKTLNISMHEVPAANKTRNRQHYSTYYSDKSKELVGEMYRKDIQIFGYRFEDRRS